MASQTELVTECRAALEDQAVVGYEWTDAEIVRFMNRVLRNIYPALYRIVVNDEIRLRYDTLTYDLSTLHPPIDGLLGVYLISTTDEYFVRRHYDFDAASYLLTFQPTFYHTVLRTTFATAQTGDKLHLIYRGHFTPFSADEPNQECELDWPDEELLVTGVEVLGLKNLRRKMIKGNERLPMETWNEFRGIINDAEREFERMLNRKTMVRHGGYPSTRRRLIRGKRVITS